MAVFVGATERSWKCGLYRQSKTGNGQQNNDEILRVDHK
jgi:hypothetical protein